MSILLIDNYDSFTHNLYHYLIQEGAKDVIVKRNDKISIDEIKEMNLRGIVLSPGPCTPNEAGICLEVVEKLKGIIPIFGVFLIIPVYYPITTSFSKSFNAKTPKPISLSINLA